MNPISTRTIQAPSQTKLEAPKRPPVLSYPASVDVVQDRFNRINLPSLRVGLAVGAIAGLTSGITKGGTPLTIAGTTVVTALAGAALGNIAAVTTSGYISGADKRLDAYERRNQLATAIGGTIGAGAMTALLLKTGVTKGNPAATMFGLAVGSAVTAFSAVGLAQIGKK